MRSLLNALQFLTIIPVRLKSINQKSYAQAAIYFPLIGLLLGIILVAINHLLGFLILGGITSSIILVVLLIILTGGLHLDGLADTFDALLSRKQRPEMLEIMRDSHIGAMGVLAIASVILLKIGLLHAVVLSLKNVSLLLMCILSRWSLVLVMLFFPYARRDGKAKHFIAGMNVKIFSLATLVAVIPVFIIWQFKGLLVLILTGLISLYIARFISKLIAGMTGDTLGALNEIIEVFILLLICLLTRGIYG